MAIGVALSAAACASQPRPRPAVATRQQPPAVVAAQPAPAIAPQALVGTWLEFWAPAGRADTERYVFSEDGRFEWRAALSSNAKVAGRTGQWALEPGRLGTLLVLHVQADEERMGCEDATCRVTHTPALEQKLPLGACPPNDEARALDPSYRCLGFDSHAFWHHEPLEPALASDASGPGPR
jgi:hypothetical protein